MPATRDGKLWRSQFYYKDWQGVRRKKNKRGFKTKGELKKVLTAATVRTYEKSDNLCYQDIYKISITEVLRRNNRIFEWRTLWKNRKLN